MADFRFQGQVPIASIIESIAQRPLREAQLVAAQDEHRRSRINEILQYVQMGQNIVSNSIDNAKRKQVQSDISVLAEAMTGNPEAKPEGFQQKAFEAGFRLAPDELGKQFARTIFPERKIGTDPRSFESYLTSQINQGLITPEEAAAKLAALKPTQSFIGTTPEGVPLFANTKALSPQNVIQKGSVPGGGTIIPKTEQRAPAEQIEKQAGFDVIEEQLNTVKGLYDPDYVGFAAGRIGKARQMTGIGATEERGEFLSNLNAIRNSLIYLRSGKAITDTEYKRLLSEVPDEDKSAVDFESKMKTFEKTLNLIMKSRAQRFKEAGVILPGGGTSASPDATKQIIEYLRTNLPKKKK